MKWDHSEIHLLQSNLDLTATEIHAQYCDKFGSEARSYDSVQKKVKKLREAFSEEDESEGSITDPVGEKLKQLERPFVTTVDSVKVRAMRDKAQLWLTELLDITSGYDWKREKKARPVTGKDSSLVVVLSDTHFGKHTEGFNLEVARSRMLSIPKRLREKELPPIDEIVVVLVGDMVEGEDIYPTQNNSIECSAIEQMQACAAAIWEMLLLFRALFRVPVRVETVPGNHGRISKTAHTKSNWDNVVYHVLRTLALEHDDDDLMVNSNFANFQLFRVKDQVGLLYHKGVKHTGTPAMREKVAGWVKAKNFDFLIHGHWHEWHVGNWLGKFVVANGCMCGPDDLAEEMGKEDTARQAYFFVTPKKPAWGFSFVEWSD